MQIKVISFDDSPLSPSIASRSVPRIQSLLIYNSKNLRDVYKNVYYLCKIHRGDDFILAKYIGMNQKEII